MPEKTNCLQVFPAAVDIRYPLALAAAVITIKHRGDRIDAQAIDVKMLKPINRAGDEETLHLAAAEIVDVSIPVGMKAFARIQVLIKRGAVEPRQAVRVSREMGGNPVQNDADAGRMQRIDKARQTLRWAEPSAGREHAERLIAPGAAERMFGHGKKLDVGKFHVDEIGNQPLHGEVPQ